MAAARELLAAHDASGATVEAVCHVIKHVGFKDELGGGKARPALTPALAVVQDADRLDAIGAVGIARCFMFGGARGAGIWGGAEEDARVEKEAATLTREEYMAASKRGDRSCVAHFADKLLKLKGLMKTDAGRRAAKGRHVFMEAFLTQLRAEWNGER